MQRPDYTRSRECRAPCLTRCSSPLPEHHMLGGTYALLPKPTMSASLVQMTVRCTPHNAPFYCPRIIPQARVSLSWIPTASRRAQDKPWRWRLPSAAHLSTTASLAKQQPNNRYAKGPQLSRHDERVIKSYDRRIAAGWNKLQRLEQQDLDTAQRERSKERLQSDMACTAAKAKLFDIFRDFRGPATAQDLQYFLRLVADGRLRRLTESMMEGQRGWLRLKLRSAVPTIFAPWGDGVGVLDRMGRVVTTAGCAVAHLVTVPTMKAMLLCTRWGGLEK
jgi:hypothetical protein